MSPPIKELVNNINSISHNESTGVVVDLFNCSKELSTVVVLEDERPVGLVMKDKLFNKLATQYGFALYCRRDIKVVMDNKPLIVEADSSIEIVAQLAMQRNSDQVYDSIIVTENGKYIGIVSVNQLLEAITNIKLEVARVSNPLTGLPGNPVIEAELLERIRRNAPWSVIYVDIDNFKGFNDRYGFERGDSALKVTSRIMTDITQMCGSPDDLVGHIGGDDFIIITRPQNIDTICKRLIEDFSNSILRIYDKEDKLKGYICTIDRQGNKVNMPIMTLSMAVVECCPNGPSNLHEISEKAAVLKRKAKQIAGNVYITN